jgi:hypothetical protein
LTDLSNLGQTYHYVGLMDKYRINGASFFNHKKICTTLYFALLGFIYLFTKPFIYLFTYLRALYLTLQSVKFKDELLVKKVYTEWRWSWANLIYSYGIFRGRVSKTLNNMSQGNRRPDTYFTRDPLQYR